MTERHPDSRPELDWYALVDRLLLEHGRLEPMELLLAADLLGYEDYEAWRLGQRSDLQGALRIGPDEAAELLRRAAAYASGQRLAPNDVEYRGWGGADRPLSIGSHEGFVAACAIAYAPPADRAQLDLFQDTSAVLAEEEIRRALAERRMEDARRQMGRLIQQNPRHSRLGGYLQLVQAIDEGGAAGAARPADRLGELEAIERLAEELLGHRARDLVTPLWVGFAEQLSGQAFAPEHPQLHASHAWARAGRWDAVRAAVEAEVDWCDHPVLVLSHGEACWRQRRTAAAWRDWMWLCWEHPSAAEHAFAYRAFPDRRLSDHWSRFGDLDQAVATEDFPAWLLIADPAAAAVPPEAAPSDERGAAYRLLHALTGDGDTIARRQGLAEVHPGLLETFLAARPRA